MKKNDTNGQMECHAEKVIKMIGGKWKLMILQELLKGNPIRFNRLHRDIEGISQKMLTRQLRELESDGLVNRKIYPEVPPKVEYSLTDRGKGIQQIFTAMHNWGMEAFEFGEVLDGRLSERN